MNRRRDAERIGFANRLAEQVDERVVDRGVLDAGWGEEEFQGVPSIAACGRCALSESRRETTRITGATNIAITSNQT
jgi:hypothetical protein